VHLREVAKIAGEKGSKKEESLRRGRSICNCKRLRKKKGLVGDEMSKEKKNKGGAKGGKIFRHSQEERC